MLFKFVFLYVFVTMGIEKSFAASSLNGGSGKRSYFCAINRNPCLNEGQCMDSKQFPRLGNSYLCKCVGGCKGFHCEECPTPTDDVCKPTPCGGHCDCKPSCKHELGYYCVSADGYLGKNCTIAPPVLHCHSDRITIAVSQALVEEYDNGLRNSFLVVQPGPGPSRETVCKYSTASDGKYEITIPMPFDTCGTISEQMPNGNVVVKNTIWFNRKFENAAFDMPIPAIAFECTYAREYELVTSMKPILPLTPTIKDEISVLPNISLCKSQACPATCPEKLRVTQGAIYTVGEDIHVTMYLDTGDSVVTTLEEIAISCSKSTIDRLNRVEIVTGGCGSLSGLPCRVTHNGASHTVCVTFQTPHGLYCNQIYIHATLGSCSREKMQQNCPGGIQFGKRCSPAPVRGRRSTTSSESVIGPFYIISGSKGIPKMRMFPDNEFATMDETLENDKNKPNQEPMDVELDKPNMPIWKVARPSPAVYYFIASAIGILLVALFATIAFMCSKDSSHALLNKSYDLQ